MKELIRIREENGKKLVSARELYLGLGLDKSQWSRWSRKNIDYNEFFVAGTDYTGVRHYVEGNEVQVSVECDELQKALKRKGIEVLGGYKSPAYNDRSLRIRVYIDIQNQIKREFGVHSYKAIKRKQVPVAKDIIGSYKAPLCISDEIYCLNNQLQVDIVS